MTEMSVVLRRRRHARKALKLARMLAALDSSASLIRITRGSCAIATIIFR